MVRLATVGLSERVYFQTNVRVRRKIINPDPTKAAMREGKILGWVSKAWQWATQQKDKPEFQDVQTSTVRLGRCSRQAYRSLKKQVKRGNFKVSGIVKPGKVERDQA